jgi:hypothetical protein
MRSRRIPEASILRRLSVAASVDPRTLLRVLTGRAVKGMAGERARAVLIDAGLLDVGKSVTASKPQ